MADTSHLVAIHERLHRERQRLTEARTESEIAVRSVWVSQAEKELASEMAFLGMDPTPTEPMTDTDLLAELLS